MNRFLTLLLALAGITAGFAQTNQLPQAPTNAEWQTMMQGAPYYPAAVTPKSNPDYPDMVVPGEYEESQAYLITWSKYNSDHRMQCALIDAIQQEVPAWIVVDRPVDTAIVMNRMTNFGYTLSNYRFWVLDNNAFWIRDYGPIGFYHSGLDSLGMVDLRYYTTRPDDDAIPEALADQLGYAYTSTNLFFEGGNFMTDGFGTGFYSTRLQQNNQQLNGPTWTTEAVADTVKRIFNLTEKVEPTTLQCDGGTGHIDIYLKLLDEQTLLVAEYGEAVTAQDRMIVEDNVVMLQALTSTYGKPYKIKRIGLPTRDNGNPMTTCNQFNNDIRGFVNGLFVNKTFIFPAFSDGQSSGNVAADEEAKALYEKYLPGYNVVGIDARGLTVLGGALHCITMQVPVENPVRFWHPPVEGFQQLTASFPVEAEITTASGVQTATLEWRLKGTTTWNSEPLTYDATSDQFTGAVPNINFTHSDTVEYYIAATSNNGKSQTKPITAPDGYYEFWFAFTTGEDDPTVFVRDQHLLAPYPNPSNGAVSVPYFSSEAGEYELIVTDLTGRTVHRQKQQVGGRGIHEVQLPAGLLARGSYLVSLTQNQHVIGTRPFIIH